MNKKIKDYIEHIKNFVLSDNFLENIILFFSVVSINFAAYVINFNINALLLVDSHAMANYFLEMIVLYVFVSMGVNIFFKAVELGGPLLYLDKNNEVTKKSLHVSLFRAYKMHELINEKKAIKYLIILVIFLWLYIGLLATLYLLFLLAMMLSFYFYTENAYYKKIKSIKIDDPDMQIIKQEAKGDDYEKFKEYWKNNQKEEYNIFDFAINHIGIILILTSFLTGLSRAEHIKETSYVNVNNQKVEYVLYMTTSSGISLYNNKNKKTSFISWDNVANLEFKKNSLISILFL